LLGLKTYDPVETYRRFGANNSDSGLDRRPESTNRNSVASNKYYPEEGACNFRGNIGVTSLKIIRVKKNKS
jgi:hypothetical protein